MLATAAFSVDALMAIVISTLRRPIEIHCPGCPHLSVDEQCLLQAASLAQTGAAKLAERTLHTALLSAQGAAFALGPLEGLGELFSRARLLFSRWTPPATTLAPSDVFEAWQPSFPCETMQ